MKAKELQGKVVKKVHQARFVSNLEMVKWEVIAIEFTDGSVIRFHVMEHPLANGYGVEGIYPARRIGE
jgi:hypothetical protein